MAEKISTLILKVDLECQHCYKKIRKTLDNLQDREKIRTISYDEKNNKVTISGPFDPKKLSKKLRSKAGEVIKDTQIVEPKKDEKPKDTKLDDKEKPKDSNTAEQAKPDKEKPTAEQAKPTEPQTVSVAQETVPAYPPAWPADPVCDCGPGYGVYYGGYRCDACGKTYGWVSGPGGGPHSDGYGNYHFFSEEDPSAASCIVM